MTKSISRSQVRLIASTNAIFGADEACATLRTSCDAMYWFVNEALDHCHRCALDGWGLGRPGTQPTSLPKSVLAHY